MSLQTSSISTPAACLSFSPCLINLSLMSKPTQRPAPGTGKNMGDGWETRRSRGKNFDWLIIKCATAGKINNIQIDTHHFKGNYPDKCSLQAAYLNTKASSKTIVKKSKKWKLLLNKVKLHAHKIHYFQNKLMKNNKVNYIKINIFPDGGISRIRAFGKAE